MKSIPNNFPKSQCRHQSVFVDGQPVTPVKIARQGEYGLLLHLPHIVIAPFGTAMQVNYQNRGCLSASGCNHSFPVREYDILVSPAFKRKSERCNRSKS